MNFNLSVNNMTRVWKCIIGSERRKNELIINVFVFSEMIMKNNTLKSCQTADWTITEINTLNIEGKVI